MSSTNHQPQSTNHSGRPPVARVILLGASNLTRGIVSIIDLARQIVGGPVEIWVAFGHGRSYGRGSTVLGRWLPGIVPCGLWHDLAAARARDGELPTFGLVTDIGNDLVYEAPVEAVGRWVNECLSRLEAIGATTIMTRLPMTSLARLTPLKYDLLRNVMFPNCRLKWPQVHERAVELNERLGDMTRGRATIVEHERQWYGWDPIHITRDNFFAAWSSVLRHWQPQRGARLIRPREAIQRWIYLRSRTPHYRKVFGWEQRAPQPSARLPDGSTVAVY